MRAPLTLVIALSVVGCSSGPRGNEGSGGGPSAALPVQDAGGANKTGGSDGGGGFGGGGSAGVGGGSAGVGGGSTGGGGGSAVGGGSGGAGGSTNVGPIDAGGAGGGSVVVDAGQGGVVGPDGGVASDGGFALRFVAMGDVGRGDQGQFDVAAGIVTWCATHVCEFAVLLGDNIYDTGVSGPNDPIWQTNFELPYAAVNMPFYALLGNHDYGGQGTGNEFNKGQFEVDYSAISTKWRMPATHYKLHRPGVDLFVANTNLSMYGLDSTVKQDFSSWLPQSNAKWKIALGHHPYRSNGPHGNAGNYEGLSFIPITNGSGVKSFLDNRVCGKADVYLSGHDHSNQWLTSRCGVSTNNPGTELIVAGAGSSATSLITSGGEFNPNHFQTLDLGFIYVEIVNNTFTGTFVGTTGNVLYTRTFTK